MRFKMQNETQPIISNLLLRAIVTIEITERLYVLVQAMFIQSFGILSFV